MLQNNTLIRHVDDMLLETNQSLSGKCTTMDPLHPGIVKIHLAHKLMNNLNFAFPAHLLTNTALKCSQSISFTHSGSLISLPLTKGKPYN